MTCRRIEIAAGVAVWTCHRAPSQPPCLACGRPGGVQGCQFELSGARAGARCGKALCRSCAGGDALCPPHRRLVERALAAAGVFSP